MTKPIDISLIIPAYNEADRIVSTLQKAKAYFTERGYTHEIIVAADGDDGTRERAAEYGRSDSSIHIIGGTTRRGKGHGIREGVTLAGAGIIGFIDADDKTPIEEFDKFMPLLSGDWDIAIGSRTHPQAVIEKLQPAYRQVGAKAFGIVMRALTGLHDVRDTQCGFKFFKRPAALDLFARQRLDGYMFDVEILYLAKAAGYRVAQIPVRWRDDADSRLQLVSGNLRNAFDLLSIPFLHRGRNPRSAPASQPTGKPQY